MKAITLTQPWASLVAIGAKRVETRSWRTDYRGPLAIHAAKGFPREARDLCFKEPFRTALAGGFTSIGGGGFYGPDDLPRVVVVAVARPVSILPTESLWGRLSEQEEQFGDYSAGRFAWQLENVEPVGPFPAIGALSLWEWEWSGVEPPAQLAFDLTGVTR